MSRDGRPVRRRRADQHLVGGIDALDLRVGVVVHAAVDLRRLGDPAGGRLLPLWLEELRLVGLVPDRVQLHGGQVDLGVRGVGVAAVIAVGNRFGEVSELRRVRLVAILAARAANRDSPSRRPERDVDHHLEPRLVRVEHRAVEILEGAVGVGERVRGIERRPGHLRRGRLRRDRRPARRQAHVVEAQVRDLTDRALDGAVGAVQQDRVILDRRLQGPLWQGATGE